MTQFANVRGPLVLGMKLAENIYVTMRNGIRLSEGVYHPENEGH